LHLTEKAVEKTAAINAFDIKSCYHIYAIFHSGLLYR